MSLDRSIFQTINHHLFGDRIGCNANLSEQYDVNAMSYEEIKKYYTMRRYEQMYEILDNEEKWKDFHDTLRHHTNGGVTNSSVVENLQDALRTNQKIALRKRQELLHLHQQQLQQQHIQHNLYSQYHQNKMEEESEDVPSVGSCDSSFSSDISCYVDNDSSLGFYDMKESKST